MDKITIKVPGAPDREIELAPGPHKVGRSVNTDLQIDHPSVSSAHCELMANGGTLIARDLGSTNGLALDGQPVRECEIAPGHSLRLGEAEIIYGTSPKIPTFTPAPAPAQYLPKLIVPRRRPPKSFYRNIPGAFLYPFKRNGLVLLASGTLFCAVCDFFLDFHVGGLLLLGWLVGGAIAGYITGYIFLYLQTIVISTAAGDENMPPWPDYDGWWDSSVYPYLQLLAIGAVCCGPAVLCSWYLGDVGKMLFLPLLIVGGIYAPMAFLAVVIDDSLFALNPLLVIPSIFRAPLDYLVCCLLLGGFYLARKEALAGIEWLYRRLSTPPPFTLPPFPVQHNFIGDLVGVFLTLYFTVLGARLIGLFYYANKDRLGWRV